MRATIDQSGRVREALASATKIDDCRLSIANLDAVLEAWRRKAVAALLEWQFEPPPSAPLVLWVQFKNGSFNGDSAMNAIFNRAGVATVESRISPQQPAESAGSRCPPAQQSFIADVRPGYSLAPDGVGPYAHGIEGVRAFAVYAITFCTDPRSCTTLPEGQPAAPSQRAVQIDLSAPVAGSGAKSLSVLRSTAANFGAFWGQDMKERTVYNGREGPVIRSVLDMPVGSTIESERIEIRFFLNDTQHILQFGPWTAGQYQDSQGGRHGEGTTRGTITRVSERTWRIRSGTDSVGRLWNNRDASSPVNFGLYRFSYEVQFDRQ